MHPGGLLHARGPLLLPVRLQQDGRLLSPDSFRDYRLAPRGPISDLDGGGLAEAVLGLAPWATSSGPFRLSAFGTGPWPAQGWKLHVSATATSAADVASACLPILIRAGARFKVVDRVAEVLRLNGGEFGASQVGKFITVYPESDAAAVELARALDIATSGLRGPDVPSDRPLRRASLVHYRYGSFRAAVAGAGNEDAILDPVGRVVEDLREPYYTPPTWAVDPFIAAGVAAPEESGRGALLGRFIVLGALSRSLWGRVYDVIDLDETPPARRALKQVWHDVAMDEYGRDSGDHAAMEAAVLSTVPAGGPLPAFFDVLEDRGDRYIVLEHVDAKPLGDPSSQLPAVGSWPGAEIAALATGLGAALKWLHDRGVIHRDIKPENIAVGRDGRVRLLDAAFSYRPGVDSGPPLGFGTPGFVDPARDPKVPTFADDVYGWAATIYLVATGEMPKPDRPDGGLRRRRSDLPRPLVEAVDRTLHNRPGRPGDFNEVTGAIGAASPRRRRRVPLIDLTPTQVGVLAEPTPDWRAAAFEAASVLVARARRSEAGAEWSPPDARSASRAPEFVYAGAAGVGLALSAASASLGDDLARIVATEAARWLCGPVFGHGAARSGLHAGEAGIGLFLLRHSGSARGPGALAEMAVMRARRMADPEPAVDDLVDGTAGLLLFLVELAQARPDEEWRGIAAALADRLVASALEHEPSGGILWAVRGLTPVDRVAYLGLLHGAAGIGLALLRAGQLLGNPVHTAAACRVALLLRATATLRDTPSGPAAEWPRQLDSAGPAQSAHCHGAGGIAQFLVRLAAHTGDPVQLDLARAAASTIAGRTPDGPSLCHGALGDAAVLLDLFQATGDRSWLSMAEARAARAVEITLRPPSRSTADPSLMLGLAGVLATAVRLTEPATSPDIILGPVASH